MPADSPYPNEPEVTTEPQRRMLDEMSRQLVQRLNDMIAEQEARVQSFTSQQHSLSSLPEPPAPAPAPLPSQPQQTQAAPQQAKAQAVALAHDARPQYAPAPSAPATAAPTPPVRDNKPSLSDAPPLPFERPVAHNGKSQKAKDENKYGWLITVGVFILFILMRSCD